MTKPTKAYIGIGSNLGDRKRYIDSSVKMLAGAPELRFLRVSEVIETAPLTDDEQPSYLNAVAEVETELDAQGMLKTLREIEALLGRVREDRWGPRTIDLDLLLFGGEILNDANLTVPHPQMHLRSFVLDGLRELNANLIHPVLGVTVGELAKRLNGRDFALDPQRPQLVSIAGVIGVGKTTLAEKLSKELDCTLLREPYDTNPFMPKVYAGRTELALDSQLYFLNGRVEQLDRDTLATGRLLLSDYVFEKELIYAGRLLNTEQFALYEDIHKRLRSKPAAPVLVIYLWESAQICLDRIHNRNRPYEQNIRRDFLNVLTGDYERLFAEWKTCPVIRLKTSELDYEQSGTIEKIARQVRYYTAMRPVSAEKRG